MRFPPPRILSKVLTWSVATCVVLTILLWPREHSLTDYLPDNTPEPAHEERPIASIPAKPKFSGAQHVFRPDGLLAVNPKGKHPIYELIKRSEDLWKRKVDRQSKTLKDAVKEYRRRYKRAPPKHFDVWLDYADFHKVQLIDEYDSIHKRLQPFWGVAPKLLQEAQRNWESHPDTFTIGKSADSDSVELLNDTMNGNPSGMQRVLDQLNILEDVGEWLPAFRATYTMHDGPAQFISWTLREAAERAADLGEYIDVRKVAESDSTVGWAAACPPTSPIHSYKFPPPGALNDPNYPSPYNPHSSLADPSGKDQTSAAQKTFIYNHRLAMSPCYHPTHLIYNGFLSQYHYPHQFGPSPAHHLSPTFAICVSPLNSDLLAVAPEQFTPVIKNDVVWGDKWDERLLWRGSNTGHLFEDGLDWNSSQRVRLVELGTRRGGEVRVLLPKGENKPVGHGETVKRATINAAYLDVAFAGKPIQCKKEVCERLEHIFEWRKFQEWGDSWGYKFIADVDGNGWSARFKRLITSNSLIFKSTLFPEWYSERIMPWVHYVPVQMDYSDLYDILAFFRGDISVKAGEGEAYDGGLNDRLAEKIAKQGTDWSERFWRKEDMTAYMFRLYLEYARVMSTDRDAMSFKEDVDDWDENEGRPLIHAWRK
ncbi:glycosyltransferase family 90 protein [Sphaerobolus stellatus SS14]|uniref:Glycosyltransferase family 90 protein n=1 Tax=Sphaerobolus stellatus (strain SS14) TaxID=990650 RepID=A0A0C9U1A8_SPHS4|nr:glycosyltransferase family 90 protein [Sphaerobolus stellatus SS14]